jgi:glycosyltransferase involved in cell wall biosynthesis
MKVIHIIDSIDKSSGGPARSVPKTCEYVSELGLDIELITRKSKNPIGVQTSASFNLTFYSFIKLIRFGFSLSKERVSLIHLQHIWSPYMHIMAWFSRRKHIPYLITTRGMLEPWIMKRNPRRKQFGMSFYQKTDLKKAACVQATCLAEMESIRNLGFTNPVAVIPNGVVLSDIPYSRIVSNTRKIVFLSRIHPKKGIELLLEAWKGIHLPDWTLEIAGEGVHSYVAKLEQQIIRDEISRVCFVGPKYGQDKWDFLHSADILILPSYSENFGIVVAEALAMGIPVITTKETPWQELESEQCGWWIDLSVEHIKKSILEATTCTPGKLTEMGQRGRRLIEQKYDIKPLAEHIKQLYDWILGTTPKPVFVYLNSDVKTENSHTIKVLHFITSIDKSGGGTTAYIQLISRELKELVDLVIVTGKTAHSVELNGVKVRFLNLSLSRLFALQKEFSQLLKIERPDVVHINGIWQPQTWLFQQAAQRLGIKVILSPHGMLESYIMNRHPLKKQLALALYEHKAIRKADYLHATAQSELNQFRKLGYGQPAQIIANGIEIADIKAKTSWNKVRNILFLSRVHPKKGLELLIEAVALLHNQQLLITIAGEGDADYVESLRKLTVQRNVSHLFHFAGAVYGEQKWELFQQSDLFVLPTYSENFGIVVAEALATGIPVITTQGTPWQELETNHCGWWIELNVGNLAKVLNEAINKTPDELKEMGLRGRKLVEEKYEIKKVAEEMVSFYDYIIH